ncbi:hypothetical protein FOXYS1_15047 [Fusarium oxysporum]|uniref:Uncharacterized protein n=1 Tax=Fusarium oxysporum TaxID=5507 RepID=A0A8H4ZNG0_FUSOX|nr:hypothetical protein FOXYS1_15047 [Fusarium oxysporum]
MWTFQFGVWCDFSPQLPRPQASPKPRSESQLRRPGRPRSDWASWAEQIRSHAAESAVESSEHLNTLDLELFHTYMTKTANTLHDGTQPHLWSEEEKLDKAYERELEVLTGCFERTFGKGQNAALNAVGKLQDVISWIYQLGDDYMEGLRQRDLMSMVILGHFCVLPWTVEVQYWFMHEWASHIIKDILAISQDSRQWLSWPLSYLNLQE